MVEKEPKRRSQRMKEAAARALLAPVAIQDTAQPPTTAANIEKHGETNKRKISPNEPENATKEQRPVSTEKAHDPRYFCPIPGCSANQSRPSSLRKHYEEDHADMTDKEEWTSKLAATMSHDEWLLERRKPSFIEAERSRRAKRYQRLAEEVKMSTTVGGTAGIKGKGKGRGRGAMTKKTTEYEKLLLETRISQTSREVQQSHGASTANGIDPTSASVSEGEPPPHSQAPATRDHTMADATLTTIDRDGSSSPPLSKRRKLNVLLDTHKTQLQSFVQQELREARDRADNAEALLQTLMTQREGVVPNDVQKDMERLKKELNESKEQVQRMEERIGNLENEIQDEKAFGLSTEMREKYLAQAKGEAKIAAKLNPSRPEYGGFVY